MMIENSPSDFMFRYEGDAIKEETTRVARNRLLKLAVEFESFINKKDCPEGLPKPLWESKKTIFQIQTELFKIQQKILTLKEIYPNDPEVFQFEEMCNDLHGNVSIYISKKGGIDSLPDFKALQDLTRKLALQIAPIKKRRVYVKDHNMLAKAKKAGGVIHSYVRIFQSKIDHFIPADKSAFPSPSPLFKPLVTFLPQTHVAGMSSKVFSEYKAIYEKYNLKNTFIDTISKSQKLVARATMRSEPKYMEGMEQDEEYPIYTWQYYRNMDEDWDLVDPKDFRGIESPLHQYYSQKESNQDKMRLEIEHAFMADKIIDDVFSKKLKYVEVVMGAAHIINDIEIPLPVLVAAGGCDVIVLKTAASIDEIDDDDFLILLIAARCGEALALKHIEKENPDLAANLLCDLKMLDEMLRDPEMRKFLQQKSARKILKIFSLTKKVPRKVFREMVAVSQRRSYDFFSYFKKE